MKKLDELYNQIKFCTILTTGRTGSDYLQGCLDNVPGVLTFSGPIFYYNFCDTNHLNSFERENLEKNLNLFIQDNSHLLIKNDIENKILNINIEKFKEIFFKISENQNLNRQKFLLTAYLSYHLSLDRDINKINIMIHHSHHINETKRFLQDFKKSKLLITIRDPRANLKSGIVNWINYDKKRENQHHFYLYIKRIREDLKFALAQENEKFFVKLEEANDIELKKKLSDFLEIKFNQNIMQSTYAGKKWKGDKISQFTSSEGEGEYKKSVQNNQWKNFFSSRDKLVLEHIYKDYRFFGYEINKINLINKIFIFFLIPLPFVFDKKIFSLKYYFSKNNSLKNKFCEIYFYLKRIVYLYMLLFKIRYGKNTWQC